MKCELKYVFGQNKKIVKEIGFFQTLIITIIACVSAISIFGYFGVRGAIIGVVLSGLLLFILYRNEFVEHCNKKKE